MLSKSRNVRSRQIRNKWSTAGLHAFLIAVFVAALGAVSAKAQEKCSDPSLDNFKHPPNTATSPLGELGRVDKAGTGPVPMILIPGAAFGGGIWKDFMDRNRNDYTMYAITPPGYEGTPPPPIPTDDNYAEQVWTDALIGAIVKLIDKEHLDRPIVVGHHMLGDYYALRLAINHPGKVGGVAVIAGAPSFAIPAFGTNRAGSPVKLTDDTKRPGVVKQFWAPFYHHVTPAMWKAGSFPARRFCKDPKRGEELYKQQVAVPVPTQVRYFLEYLSADLTSSMSKIQAPVLVVVPKIEWTEDAAFDAFKEGGLMMAGGDEAKARANWKAFNEQGWGELTTATKWTFDQGFQWEQVRGSLAKFTLKYVDDTRIFIMEDQPQALDQELRRFIAGL